MKNNSNLKIKFDEENIDLNKITVVSGVNGSGKSTVSRTVYCFLKTMSPAIDQFIFKKFVSGVNTFIKRYINSNDNYQGNELYDSFTIKDDYSTILREFYKYKSIFLENRLDKDYHQTQIWNYELIFRRINKLIDLIETNNSDSIFKKLRFLAFDEVVEVGNITFQGDGFKFVPDNVEESYFNNEFIVPDVFYIDNISILDLKHSAKSYLEHIDSLNDNLDFEILKVKFLSDDAKRVLNKIEEITQGTYPIPDDDYYFSKEYGAAIDYLCVPSGIKQIGVIWMLIANFKLQKGSFLIFDEPEVNLHPDWQFKFAEILVLLVKELDVKIYLNSHSPMFIESISAFSEYYDMQDDVNYYLVEESLGKYNFRKVPPNKLYKIYNNLGNVYDLIDELRLKKMLR